MKVDQIIQGNCLDILKSLPEKSVHCCVTSPPYWGLRDYGVDGQLGLESSPSEFVANMVNVFREVHRVLRDDGTLWINLGDSYAGSGKGAWNNSQAQKEVYVPKPGGKEIAIPKTPEGLKPKDLVGIPWRVALALQEDGWYLRSDIIWSKPNPMPESVTDRPTKAHEYIFLLTKSQRYFYDNDAVKEPISASSVVRLAQDLEGQKGSMRANGGAKTNGPMKAVLGKGNAKTFRGGGKYTSGKSFDNSSLEERDSHGNKANESGMRNRRTVWTVATQSFSEAHFATFPTKLIEPCILAGCPQGGIVLDPFMGSGTTAIVAKNLGRSFIGTELNPEYIKIAEDRIRRETAQMNIFEFGT